MSPIKKKFLFFSEIRRSGHFLGLGITPQGETKKGEGRMSINPSRLVNYRRCRRQFSKKKQEEKEEKRKSPNIEIRVCMLVRLIHT
jgi:hypothetical protein